MKLIPTRALQVPPPAVSSTGVIWLETIWVPDNEPYTHHDPHVHFNKLRAQPVLSSR